MSGEHVDVAAGAHIPDADDAIAAAGAEDVEGGVQLEGVDATEMAVVFADDFVRFQVPALDLFVLGAAEQVWVARADG